MYLTFPSLAFWHPSQSKLCQLVTPLKGQFVSAHLYTEPRKEWRGRGRGGGGGFIAWLSSTSTPIFSWFACVRVCLLWSKWMRILLNCISCCSMLSLFLLEYTPWAVIIRFDRYGAYKFPLLLLQYPSVFRTLSLCLCSAQLLKNEKASCEVCKLFRNVKVVTKRLFVATNIILSRQKTCFVATKMILVNSRQWYFGRATHRYPIPLSSTDLITHSTDAVSTLKRFGCRLRKQDGVKAPEA